MHVTPLKDLPLHVLMFLRTLEPAMSLVQGGTGRRVSTSDGHGVIFTGLLAADFERLHRENHCMACFHHWRAAMDDDGDAAGVVASRGMFLYEHATDNWISGPYGCTQSPTQPLEEKALSAEIKKSLVRFPGRFLATPFIQPAAHWECESWNASWLGTDEKTVRPFPGHEPEYAEEYAQSHDSGQDGLVWTPVDAQPRTRETVKAARRPWWKFW